MAQNGPENADLSANTPPYRASGQPVTSAATSGSLPVGGAVEGHSQPRGCRDHAWVLRLIRAEGQGISRMLWRILGREQDVMDAYQDCFCKLAQRGRPDRLASAKGYIYRTAANIAIEMIRVRKRRATHWPRVVAEHATDVPFDDPPDEAEDPTGRLRDVIARLPAHLRNVVVLRDLSRMSYEQVGKTLGITPATARVYRRHAVVKLAELLEKGDPS